MDIKVVFTVGLTNKRIIHVIPPQGFCEDPFKLFAEVKYDVVYDNHFNVLLSSLLQQNKLNLLEKQNVTFPCTARLYLTLVIEFGGYVDSTRLRPHFILYLVSHFSLVDGSSGCDAGAVPEPRLCPNIYFLD